MHRLTERAKKCLHMIGFQLNLFCKEKHNSVKRNKRKEWVMGSMKEHPRYHVVSLRISDEEREALEAFAQRTSRNVSQLMREAMGLLRRKMEMVERT